MLCLIIISKIILLSTNNNALLSVRKQGIKKISICFFCCYPVSYLLFCRFLFILIFTKTEADKKSYDNGSRKYNEYQSV